MAVTRRTAMGAGRQPEAINAYVGRRLQERRVLIGLSLEDLAAALEVTPQQVRSHEDGLSRIGGLRLFEMARVLGVTVSYLFGTGTAPSKDAGPGDAMPAGGSVAHGTGVDGASLAHDGQEAAELVRGYAAISDPFIRQRILQLVQSMAPKQP